MDITIQQLLPDITFKTSRSGGKGGQNVNKVSSKAELNFDYQSSKVFNEHERERLKQKLVNRMTAEGLIQVICEEERSQYLNKEKALRKLWLLLKDALYMQKARKATKPKRSAIEQRLKTKQQLAAKKLNRSKRDFDF